MDIFSEDKLNKIFKCYEGQDSTKIISRESTTLEFKASFSTSAIPRYAKTMAAFANRDGGYIIFGVKNNPRMVIGLKDHTFDEYDDEKFVKNSNEYFSPEIKYDRIQIDYKELKVGIIYVFPAESKPVVCTKNYNSGDKQLLREGAIYYRYRSASSEIKYPDLKILLNKQKEDERKLWLQTFAKVAKIGVNNLSLIDLKNGTVSIGHFPKNKDIFINEELLKQIKLIKEGQFVEKDGAPTLKIIGEIKSVSGAVVYTTKTAKTIVPTNLTEKYLLTTFINQTGTDSAMNYIDAFCHFAIKYLPFYYFIYLIQKTDNTFDKSKLKAEINKITADSKSGKKFLLERLKSDETFNPEKLTGKDLSLKTKYFNLFNNTETKIEDIPDENIDIQLRMILNIVNKERIKNLIIHLLKVYLNKYYETHKPLLRKAISYVDKLLYADKLINF